MIEDKEVKVIINRWKEFHKDDIELFKALPNWRTIVSDIKYLISALEEYDDQEAYNEGYENGYDSGYDAGLADREE